MTIRNRSHLIAAVGVGLLFVGLGLSYVSLPSYTTEIEARAPDKHAMADELEQYSASEIDGIPFENLSTAEKTAFKRARHSPQNQYSDHGASDNGTAFEYRNDIINQYFVTYEGNLYSVTVVIETTPLMNVSGIVSVVSAVGLLGLAFWKS